MIATLLYTTAGLLFLYVGAECLVRGSAALALRFGLTPLVVGLTVVAYGTSSPELVVSIKASLSGNTAISLGNVIGSNICNIGLILGLCALIRPLQVRVQSIRLEVPVMIVASFLLYLVLLDGRLSRLEGIALFAGMVGFTIFVMRLALKQKAGSLAGSESLPRVGQKAWVDPILILGGLGLLIGGAHLFIQGAVGISEILRVPEAIVALTVVAVGTSLPELATSVVATLRHEDDISIGNIVGSNIFNILCILGAASLIRPLHGSGLRQADLLVMAGMALVLLPLAWSGFRLSRWEGMLLLSGYGAYLYTLFL